MANFTLQQIRGNQLQEVALTPGQTLPVQPGVIYRVKDATGAQPHRLVLRRLGRNLVVDVEGRTVCRHAHRAAEHERPDPVRREPYRRRPLYRNAGRRGNRRTEPH